jgi:hypothetical protein
MRQTVVVGAGLSRRRALLRTGYREALAAVPVGDSPMSQAVRVFQVRATMAAMLTPATVVVVVVVAEQARLVTTVRRR